MFCKFRKNHKSLELLQNRNWVPGWCPAVGETRFPSIGFGSESNADTMLSPMLTRLVKISCRPLNLDLAIHNLCNFLVGLSGSWIFESLHQRSRLHWRRHQFFYASIHASQTAHSYLVALTLGGWVRLGRMSGKSRKLGPVHRTSCWMALYTHSSVLSPRA